MSLPAIEFEPERSGVTFSVRVSQNWGLSWSKPLSVLLLGTRPLVVICAETIVCLFVFVSVWQQRNRTCLW